jgi:hypothetical protein
MGDEPIVRKGKQLWMHGKLIADCASEGIAAALMLGVIRGKVTASEAALFEAVFK